jgi:hypothetical protein
VLDSSVSGPSASKRIRKGRRFAFVAEPEKCDHFAANGRRHRVTE